LILAGASLQSRAADDVSPEGRWTTIDDHTGEMRSIVRVQVEHGELRGEVERILARPGEDADPVCGLCQGPRHNQRVIGMQILGGHRRERERWTGGRILDPDNGKEYSSTVWLEARTTFVSEVTGARSTERRPGGALRPTRTSDDAQPNPTCRGGVRARTGSCSVASA
jgi:hypothetical protein